MYFILADDFLMSGYCPKCKCDTKWLVIFEAINFEKNVVSFITECTKCLESNKDLKGYRVNLNFEEWLLMIPHSYLHDQ